jgi:hypothetical protein
MDAKETVDVFWFYFGYAGLFTLRDENGWSYERAERWLSEEASRALLQNHQTGSDRAGCQTTNRRGRLDD